MISYHSFLSLNYIKWHVLSSTIVLPFFIFCFRLLSIFLVMYSLSPPSRVRKVDLWCTLSCFGMGYISITETYFFSSFTWFRLTWSIPRSEKGSCRDSITSHYSFAEDVDEFSVGSDKHLGRNVLDLLVNDGGVRFSLDSSDVSQSPSEIVKDHPRSFLDCPKGTM